MRRFWMYSFGLALLLVCHQTTHAATARISHQGIASENGTLLSGNYDFTFRLYADSLNGSALWTESFTLPVQQGRFNASLGSVNPLPVEAYTLPGLWLETEVQSTILPRQRLSPAHAAIYADSARVAGSTASGDNLWSTDGTNVTRSAGSVGIGTPDPLSIAWFANPSIVLSGQRPTLSLNTTAVGGLATFQFLGPTTGSQFHLNIADGSPAFLNLRSYWGQQSEILHVSGDGKFGLMTTSPQATLDVAGDAMVNNFWARGDANFTRAGGSGLIVQTPSSDVRLFSPANVPIHIGTNGVAQMLTISPSGNVNIAGSLNVVGTKCREVDTPEYGKLYYNAVESGHAIFTLSGRAKLKHGTARIDLDPKWMAGVTIDDRHPLDVSAIVFYGPHGNWYVTPDQSGFTLTEATGTDAEFFWTVQASQMGYEYIYLNRPEALVAKDKE